jgi:uncharacterized membrane protein
MPMNKEVIARLASQLLEIEDGELRPREKAVIQKAVRRLAVSRDINLEFTGTTFGQRLADRVAAIGGSWGFIILFLVILVGWMALNSFALAEGAFDPFPYILLNLLLSTLAAIQAPIILMSQNRQATRDRIAATHDYEVNLKAEIEIAALHEKLDQIRATELAVLCQWVGQEREGR